MTFKPFCYFVTKNSSKTLKPCMRSNSLFLNFYNNICAILSSATLNKID